MKLARTFLSSSFRPSDPLVCRLVVSIMIASKGEKLHFHAPIGALPVVVIIHCHFIIVIIIFIIIIIIIISSSSIMFDAIIIIYLQ